MINAKGLEADLPTTIATDVCALRTVIEWADGRSTDEQWSDLHGSIQDVVLRALSAHPAGDGLEVDGAVSFMLEAARYFGKRETGGEDMAFWANVTNQRNCQGIAGLLSNLRARVEELTRERDEARAELQAHDLSFDLRYKSDMRACKRWQEATGKTMTLPDHTDLSMWLFSKLEAAEAEVKRLREALEPFAEYAPYVEMFVQGRAAQGGSPVLPTKYFRLSHFQAARAALTKEGGNESA